MNTLGTLESRQTFALPHRALRTQLGFIALTLGAACSSDGGYEPAYSQRSATDSECSSGGSVLLVDGKAQAIACNGAPGETGAPGHDGPPGVKGAPGVGGPAGVDGEDFSSMVLAVASFAESLVGVVCCETADPADADNLCASGSGVKTTPTRISTARHVVDGMTVCGILSGTDSTVLGTSTAIRPSVTGADAAQIELELDGPIVPSVVAYRPVLGEPVIVVGQPGTHENQYTFGHVTATSLADSLNAAGITDWPNSFSIDAVASHGNSGGAVFNEHGVCIGLLVGGLNGGPDNSGPDTDIVLPFPSEAGAQQ